MNFYSLKRGNTENSPFVLGAMVHFSTPAQTQEFFNTSGTATNNPACINLPAGFLFGSAPLKLYV